MSEATNTNASPGYSLVFSCSGAADVGAIADLAARKLASDTPISLCCTAAVAAGIPGILQKARGAREIVAVDGCNLRCTRKILDNAELPVATYIELENLDMPKGDSPCTPERVDMVVDKARECCGI